MNINCEHREILMENCEGKKLQGTGREVDFIIRCYICKEELFRISEYKRRIHNLSKH